MGKHSLIILHSFTIRKWNLSASS